MTGAEIPCHFSAICNTNIENTSWEQTSLRNRTTNMTTAAQRSIISAQAPDFAI